MRGADELACKPDPVHRAPYGVPAGGHPSRPAVAGRLQRPTRRHRAGHPQSPAQRTEAGAPFGLAPGGVYRAVPVTRDAGGLLHHRFTLTPAPSIFWGGAVCFLWHCPAGHPGLPLATTLSWGVRTFLGSVARVPTNRADAAARPARPHHQHSEPITSAR